MNSTLTTKTTKTGKSQAMKPSTQAHPLASALSGLTSDAKALATATTAQAQRNLNLAALRANEAATLARVASEEISYKAGAAELAETRAEIDALAHGIELRAGELVASANSVLSTSLELKQSTLAALYIAGGHLATQRQAEVAALLGRWGGTQEVTDPMPLAVISASCERIRAVEALAAGVEAWTPSQGFKALATVLQPAVAVVAEVGAPAPPDAVFGGFTEHQRGEIFGWRDHELKKTLIFNGSVTAARAAYAEIQNRPGHLDFARVELFLASSDHTTVFQNHPGRGCDGRDISAMQTGSDHDGKSAGFLTKTAAWLS